MARRRVAEVRGHEMLCRYGARGALPLARLRRLDDGRYEYRTKRAAVVLLTASALVTNPRTAEEVLANLARRAVAHPPCRWSSSAVSSSSTFKNPTSSIDQSCVAKVEGINFSLPRTDYNQALFGTTNHMRAPVAASFCA
jgi:hypothetical protein